MRFAGTAREGGPPIPLSYVPSISDYDAGTHPIWKGVHADPGRPPAGSPEDPIHREIILCRFPRCSPPC